MDNYEKLIGDIGDILIAHPSESVSKMFLKEAVNAIEQLVKERDKLKLDLCEANDVIEYANDKLKKVTKERDFMYDYIPRQCNTCKNYSYTADAFGLKAYGCIKGGCADWKRKENWEWDGVIK